MRYWAVLAVLMMALTGCARVVAGTAEPDQHPPGVALGVDGFGIVVGFPDAPVQLELFTEPQCDHCAHFQATFGEDIRSGIQSGRLAVTYRLLTFFDDSDTGYSHTVSNALFLAAGPTTTASVFQKFVESLWANQDLAHQHYTDGDFADQARQAGVTDAVVAQITAGRAAVDTVAMDEHNTYALSDTDSPGTPTVYDVHGREVVDISDPDWLDALLRGA
ncbi:MAG: thioredoxin domain-containing protein [Mycobacterium sp.]